MAARTGTIDWSSYGREEFERIVEVLLRRKWEKVGATVVCPDGRGGDDGIDVEVRHSDGHRSIYQIKYFKDGFTGNLKSSRQRQISKSFVTAMKLSPVPTEWALVIPAKLTKGERDYVLKLEGHKTLEKEGIAPPAIGIVGITELDDMATDDPGIYRYFARDLLKSDVEAFGLETATLTGGTPILHRRLRALGDLADSTDPHWGIDFARHGDSTTMSLRPLHSAAAEMSPITISAELTQSPEYESVRTQLERNISFGASGDVVLPQEMVKQITISGPEMIRGTHDGVTVVLQGEGIPAAVGTPVTMQFFDAEGTLHDSHDGVVTYADSGTRGIALRVSFYGHYTCEFLLPLEESEKEGRIDRSFSLVKVLPKEAVGIINLEWLFQVDDAVCKVFANGDRLATFTVPPIPVGEEDDVLDIVYNCARDLDIIQSHLRTTFYLPDKFSVTDRINLRIARIMIGGHITQSVHHRAITGTMSGADTPEIRKQLSEIMPLSMTVNYSFRLGNRTIELGPATVCHNAVRAVNGSDAIAALNAGTAEKFEVEFKPTDNPYFNICLPKLVRDPENLMTAEWSLPGIRQPGTDTN